MLGYAQGSILPTPQEMETDMYL